jgi:hypothetical protein
MTTIRATCPVCDEVELDADELSLFVCPTAPKAFYAFDCPSCHEEVRKNADDHVVDLLMRGGVEPLTWDIPAESLEEHQGAPLNYDDLLDFVLSLGIVDDLATHAKLTVRR